MDCRESDAQEQRESGSTQIMRPFDTSGIDLTPRNEKDDPPYRSWWVVERDDE